MLRSSQRCHPSSVRLCTGLPVYCLDLSSLLPNFSTVGQIIPWGPFPLPSLKFSFFCTLRGWGINCTGLLEPSWVVPLINSQQMNEWTATLKSGRKFALGMLAWSAEILGDEAFLSTRQGVSDDSAPSGLDASWGRWPVWDHEKQHEVVSHVVWHQKGLGSSMFLTIPADPNALALYSARLPHSSQTWVWLFFKWREYLLLRVKSLKVMYLKVSSKVELNK